jgi:hypoxanthine phosphoribosyltransferase
MTELARSIAGDLPNRTPLIVGILTGSFIFLADLVRALARLNVEPQIDFMAVSHYGAATESRCQVKLYKDTTLDITARAVLLVDDILDTGRSLSLARDRLAARSPMWLRTCVLLDKPSRRAVPIKADYVGFNVPDVWVIGYGLDAAGDGRALPYVAAFEPEG